MSVLYMLKLFFSIKSFIKAYDHYFFSIKSFVEQIRMLGLEQMRRTVFRARVS